MCETEGIPERQEKMFTKSDNGQQTSALYQRALVQKHPRTDNRDYNRALVQKHPRTDNRLANSFNSFNSPASKASANSFNSFNFTTELCIDLKTILTSDRKAKRFKDYTGVLTRDGRDHFTFIENAQERKIVRRYPCIYKGFCLNVHRRGDGLLYLNFRHPEYTRFYTFKDFCREAAEELMMVVGLVEEE